MTNSVVGLFRMNVHHVVTFVFCVVVLLAPLASATDDSKQYPAEQLSHNFGDNNNDNGNAPQLYEILGSVDVGTFENSIFSWHGTM